MQASLPGGLSSGNDCLLSGIASPVHPGGHLQYLISRRRLDSCVRRVSASRSAWNPERPHVSGLMARISLISRNIGNHGSLGLSTSTLNLTDPRTSKTLEQALSPEASVSDF